MIRNNWLKIHFLFISVWVIDFLSKKWAIAQNIPLSFGFVETTLHYNQGSMLGLFSSLPPFLRVVTLSTAGAFIVVIYALVQYLLPIRSVALRCGMSIFLGGIVGNLTDRIVWGRVTDFISLGFNGKTFTGIFNLADVFQWIGYFIIVYQLFFRSDRLWMENNQRKKYWINPSFQLKYCYLLLAVGLSISLVSMVFSYTYLRVSLIEIVGHNNFVLNKFLAPFFLTFLVISIAFCFMLFAVGKIISHKIAGPVYAFEKYLIDILAVSQSDGTIKKFKMRTSDEFPELENIARLIALKLTEENEKNELCKNINSTN